MAGSSAFFRLLVILLGLSHLICLNAVPVTRSENLMQSPDQAELDLENIHKDGREKNWERWVPIRSERMDIELRDYGPSGANGHHTPKPPYP